MILRILLQGIVILCYRSRIIVFAFMVFCGFAFMSNSLNQKLFSVCVSYSTSQHATNKNRSSPKIPLLVRVLYVQMRWRSSPCPLHCCGHRQLANTQNFLSSILCLTKPMSPKKCPAFMRCLAYLSKQTAALDCRYFADTLSASRTCW